MNSCKKCLIAAFLLLVGFNFFHGQVIQVLDKEQNQIIDSIYFINSNGKRLNTIKNKPFLNYKELVNSNEFAVGANGFYSSNIIYKNELSLDTITVYLDPNYHSLDAVITYGIKRQDNKQVSAHKISKVSKDDIRFIKPPTMADALGNVGEVFIQKSQQGGGSPMLRGFAANSILIVVDGIRMNNAIFRSGNLQNIIAIDPFTVEETNVILGPGSVLYGSDALGGVLSVHTNSLSTSDSLKISGVLDFNYSEAFDGKSSSAKFIVQDKKWSSLSAFSYKVFGDVRMGKHGPKDYLRSQYVVQGISNDSLAKNVDPLIQKNSGYSQKSFLQKILFKPSRKLSLNYKFSYSETSDIPRYDRLIQPAGDSLQYGEWYYGPSIWQVHSLQSNFKGNSWFFDEWESIFSYQSFKESRNDRKFNNPTLRQRSENVKVLGIEQNFLLKINNKLHFNYGIDGYFNKVSSTAFSKRLHSNEVEVIVTRYPDGATHLSLGSYIHINYELNPKTFLSVGGRLNYVEAKADLEDNLLNLPYATAEFKTYAFSGSFNLKRILNDIFTINTSLSSGFRAPNIDDLAKIFDSEPGSVVVPNPSIKPEYLYALEVRLNAEVSKKLNLNLTTYASKLKNALVRADFSINGTTSLDYDGELSNIQALQNASESTIYGASFDLNYQVIDELKFNGNFNYVFGEDHLKDGTTQSRRHVAPTNANVGLIYEKAYFTLAFNTVWNAEIKAENLAPSEASKAYLYAKDKSGLPYVPEFFVFNFRSEIQMPNNCSIQLGLENIFNKRYRPYSSGITAPGRNFTVGFNWKFS